MLFCIIGIIPTWSVNFFVPLRSKNYKNVLYPTFADLSALSEGIVLQQKAAQVPLSELLLDSRRVRFANKAIFFALVGNTHDGHRFLGELYAKGVRRFVVSQTIDPNTLPEADILYVPDTIIALQSIAAAWRQRFGIPVLGITGSNGKTIVKEWLHQLLYEQYYIVRSPKSYNSQIGVPLSVWQMTDRHEWAILEAGISQRGEMARLAAIIQPTMGILTNIGAAHDKGFDNRLEKTIEKLQLFRHAQVLVYRARYDTVTQALEQLRLQYPGDYACQCLIWELYETDYTPPPNTPICIKATRHRHHTDLDLICSPNLGNITFPHPNNAHKHHPNTQHNSNNTKEQGKNLPSNCHFRLPFTDDAHIENAIHCIVLSLYCGIDPQNLAQHLRRLQPVAMRLTLKAGINQCAIIDDAYSADLHSLAIALDFMAQQQRHTQKTVILSDILESGQPRAALYAQVADLLTQKGITRFVGIGERVGSCAELFYNFNAIFFRQTNDFLAQTPSFNNETILVKGARAFSFEKIVAHLEQKNHSTVLEIDLDAIAHNFKFYRSLLRPNVQIMVMVKAFSYGSGTYEIANLLQYHKADYLSVAYTDEGVALRRAGIKLPIMVLNPLPETFDQLTQYELEPEIYSFEQGKQFLTYLASKGKKRQSPYPIHLKLDTGMHRLGLERENLTKILPLIHNKRYLEIVSIFTHLAATDETQHDDFTLLQWQRFEEMCQLVSQTIDYPIKRHALNTAGIARFPDMQADMVRLGLGLYGFDSSQTVQNVLRQVGTLKTYISQIKTVSPPETVGYGRRGQLSRTSRIATVSIGYADGLNRRLSNGKGKMLVKGKIAPIVGNICMDMTMIDITDIENAQVDDEVIVFGEQLPVQTLAQQLDTIPYEILTAISGRVKRVYFQSEN